MATGWRPQVGGLIRVRTTTGTRRGQPTGGEQGSVPPWAARRRLFERDPPGARPGEEGQATGERKWTGLLRWIRANSRGSRPQKGWRVSRSRWERESVCPAVGAASLLMEVPEWSAKAPRVYESLSSASGPVSTGGQEAMYCYSATSLDGWRTSSQCVAVWLAWLASLSAACCLLSVGSLSQSTGVGSA